MPHTHRRSAVLILALLLMGAIVGSTISLSTIIADSGHQTQTINDFIAASLAADSGLERGLAVVKVARASESITDATTSITSTTAIQHVDVVGAQSALSTDQISWPRLRPRESVSFDILQFDLSGDLKQPDSTSIQVRGDVQDIIGLTGLHDGRGALDISWVGLDTTGQPVYSGRRFLVTNEFSGGATANPNLLDNVRDLDGNPISLSSNLIRGFRIRITAVDNADIIGESVTNNIAVDTVKNLLVTGAPGGFPSRIDIKSTGTVNKSQSQKAASVLWQLPSSPVFNYVLFTEGGIIPLE
ncbi:MAG: hypothetical protein AAB402_01500 [Patescibacteria group bacterium]